MRDRASDAAVRRDFEEFVREHWSSLMHIGYAVSGSQAAAEDLVQTALTAAYPKWRRIRRDEALAYLRRSILNVNVSTWRRHRGGEMSMADVPDPPRDHGHALGSTSGVDDRESLLPLLGQLPERQRAVLVLRYLCDLADADIAATLGIAAPTVRSQAMRGLASLRVLHSGESIEEAHT